MKITNALASLKVKAAAAAGSSGAKDILATQEVKFAYERGDLTKAERDVLARALSDGGNGVASVQKKLDEYGDVFALGDTNKSGRIEKGERDAHQTALDKWMWLAASTQVPQAEKDALKVDVLQVKRSFADGRVVSVPVWGVRSLLKKLDKLVDE